MSSILSWVVQKVFSIEGAKALALIVGVLGYQVDPGAAPLIVQLVAGAYALIHMVHKPVTTATVETIAIKQAQIVQQVNDPEGPPTVPYRP